MNIRGGLKKFLNVVVNILFVLYIIFCMLAFVIVAIITRFNIQDLLFLISMLSVPIILFLALKNKKAKYLSALCVSVLLFIITVPKYTDENNIELNNDSIVSESQNEDNFLSFSKINSDSNIQTLKETTQETLEETFNETLEEQQIQDNKTKLAESRKKASSQIKSVKQTLDENKKKENNVKYYEIEKIVDGDTIRIYKDGKVEKIRLLLVDTPESVHSQQYKNVKLGTSAYIFTRNFLQGHKVSLEYDEEKIDRYGRTLAYVYRDDGKSLNKALLQASLAKVVLYEPNDKYYNEYKAIERQVRAKGNGIWANIEAAFPGKTKEAKIKEQKKKIVQNKKIETKQKTENIEHKKQR